MVGIYYDCDECYGYTFCFKCYRSKDLIHPRHFFNCRGEEDEWRDTLGDESYELEDDRGQDEFERPESEEPIEETQFTDEIEQRSDHQETKDKGNDVGLEEIET